MDIAAELDWERTMLEWGVSRFRAQQTSARDRGDHTGTAAGKSLLKAYLSQVSEYIANYVAGNGPDGRRRTKLAGIISTIDPDKLALFTLTELISSAMGGVYMTKAMSSLGAKIEDELRFAEFEISHPGLFAQLERDLERRNTVDYRHRHRVFTHAMNKHAEGWATWGDDLRARVGSQLLSLAMSATDLFTTQLVVINKKKHIKVVATQEVLDWIANSEDAMAGMLPYRLPMICPPEDWEDIHTGGYYLPKLRSYTGLVKRRKGKHMELLAAAKMPEVLSAVNAMQRTGWRVNRAVLETAQRVWEANLGIGMPASQPYVVPPSPVEKKPVLTPAEQEALDLWKAEAREVYTLEGERQKLLLSTSQSMRLAEMLKDHAELYFVYQLDFRGRVYAATSGVSPQGGDLSKALLEFVEEKPLGAGGMYWLAVHGANKYGVDKCSYEDRVKWVNERSAHWAAVAEDPIGNRQFWKDADKPYQFLAWCLEYAQAMKVGPEFRSRLPVALDGSCNGLQHFSAMLADPVGGAAVNLVPGDRPSDIYQDVADVASAKLRGIATQSATEGAPAAAQAAAVGWLAMFTANGMQGMPRSLSKKPVMTLPYGSTRRACTGSVYAWYLEQSIKPLDQKTLFSHCDFLAGVLWDSISEVVVAARAAMGWIQQCASEMAKAGHPLVYTSPLGFPVFQGTNKTEVQRIKHKIGGPTLSLSVYRELPELCPRKQRQGSSPNFVHHCDAAHLMMCVNAAHASGVSSFAMIHDDFGCHAADIPTMHRVIREQFVRLHTEFNVLADFKRHQEAAAGIVLPPVPDRGALNVRAVLDSPYFFG